MDLESNANTARRGPQTVDWQRLAEENEQLCLEQMEQVRSLQATLQEAESALVVERQTVASQRCELQELRRNLERSNGIIRSLEQRLSSLQTNVSRLEQREAQTDLLEAHRQEADCQVSTYRAQAEEAKAQLARANTRLIAVERQLLQLKSVMDKAVFGRAQPLVPVSETAVRASAGSIPRLRVELPSFLKD